jgi:hypothetical protein
MSTCRIEVEEGEEVEEVEDGDSGAPESRLALKLASFGMAACGHYTPGEYRAKA